jgi:hypothetical protein
MAQPSTDDVIVIGSNGLQNMQETDGILQLCIRAANEARGIEKIPPCDVLESALQLKSSSLHQEFRSLMYHLEGELVLVKEFLRLLLQSQQLVGAQVTLIIRRSLAWKNRFTQIFGFVHAVCEILDARRVSSKSYHSNRVSPPSSTPNSCGQRVEGGNKLLRFATAFRETGFP